MHGSTRDGMAALFGPEGRVGAMLEVEASLAEAQATLGVIPAEAGSAIAAVCRSLQPDPDRILGAGEEEGTPLIPLLDLIREHLREEHRVHLHHDTTTQDIVDTALVWRSATAIGVLARHLVETGYLCSRLAHDHLDTPMTGRSFLQAARPITFGARAASWLDSVTRRLLDLHTARGCLEVQWGGPVGLGSGMGGKSREVAALLAERLGLAAARLPWQSDREPVVALAATVARAVRTVEKIAADLMSLAQTEVGEVSMRPGGSTAMPHKRNPVDAMTALSASRIAVSAAAGLLTSPPPRLERDAGGWQAEWPLLAQVFEAAETSVLAVNRALATIDIHPDRMRSNLETALGDEQPDLAAVHRLVAAARARFEDVRAGLVS